MIGYHYHLLALLLLAVVVTAGRRHRFEPLPECSECISREDALAPGIGFDLTDSCGTAAIRYNNKSVVNLGKVEANQEYIELVERLSDPSTKLSCHSTTWEEIHCSYLRQKRRLNKLRGRPATRDVGILANLMSQLHTLVDAHLGAGTTKSVLPTMPNLPGLEQEDLQDALQHIGLRALVTHKHGRYVWETSAAFAGMGFGLCAHPEDCDACEDEEADMPFRHTLALSLTNRSFSAAYTHMQSAFRSSHEAESVRFELGLEKQGEETYWERLREVIVDVGQETERPLDTLLLLGEGAGLPEFARTVQDALTRLLELNIGSEVNIRLSRQGDPLYIAARGAADFAKRAQSSPPNCREPARCFKDREIDDSQEALSDEL
ncbi:hypothetical protein LAWI1_G000759 [Lachnellula willkommii]|uniref:Uncharacterized protein n=1 Tax=Lachnellula willkommii TaxID=215461 RepID=A0A559MN92_9HELO|nr:hypothetical protein LAWI1_G000759 [Lachnellula willkommii]